MNYIIWFHDISTDNQLLVGGKNASLGYMINDLADKVRIPDGFAISVDGYWHFLQANNLDRQLAALLKKVDVHNLNLLKEQATALRKLIVDGVWPDDLKDEVTQAYYELCTRYKQHDLPVAVRSSATAEDLPTASFAGQQETFLHITGAQALLEAAKKCMASLFTERALFYRTQHGFDHMKIGLSVGVQKMVQADDGAAGVAFSCDTETGFKDVVMINGSWGLGEVVVKGSVTPDEFMVFKPTLLKGYKPIIKKKLGTKKLKLMFNQQKHTVAQIDTTEHERSHFCLSDNEILELSGYIAAIERYYSTKYGRWMPQDVEWAKDGVDGLLYIVQSRPETVHGSKDDQTFLQTYQLNVEPSDLQILTEGLSIGQQIATGRAHVISSIDEIEKVKANDIIITQMTDPDWVPAMKKAAGIITDQGGRTCHAAIVSRELGIPAIVGTGNATHAIQSQEVTIDCTQGETGYVYAGAVPFTTETVDLAQLPPSPVTLLVNIADPNRAFSVAQLPVQGVGLARLEFILSNQIGIHPMAIVDPKQLEPPIEQAVAAKSVAYENPQQFFVDTLAQGIGMIAAAFYPHEVCVRLSDFKTNEYRNLLGGKTFEPIEENPMLGWRGASRYYHEEYTRAFALECAAFKKARQDMGFDNIRIMVPFVRTVREAHKVVDQLAHNGLERGKDNLQLVMMCEVPSNIVLIDQFAPLFDGFSIGSNDLTQLVLGVDRDSARLADLFDERDDAVKKMIEMAIKGAHKAGNPIGICGQAPSDYPAFTQYLIAQGIDSVSLNPDAVMPFLLHER